MLEYAILGIIQGIAEWLPISSKSLLILAQNYFEGPKDLDSAMRVALVLHLGTFAAGLLYFHREVKEICRACLASLVRPRGLDDAAQATRRQAGLSVDSSHQPSPQNQSTQKLIVFLVVTTAITGALGICILKIFDHLLKEFKDSGRVTTFLIGSLLWVTAFLQFKATRSKSTESKHLNQRELKDLTLRDSMVLGLVQGLAVIPGLSRSGVTVAALLLRKFNKTSAIKLSFLMSLPVVLVGNIILNMTTFPWSPQVFVGLMFSFVFGLATIHALLKVAECLNFGYFLILFGLLTILAAFV